MDYRLAISFGSAPFFMEATSYNIWIRGIPTYRRPRYEASRGIQTITVTIDGFKVSVKVSDQIGVWPEVWAAFEAGDISRTMPLCERINGYGDRTIHNG